MPGYSGIVSLKYPVRNFTISCTNNVHDRFLFESYSELVSYLTAEIVSVSLERINVLKDIDFQVASKDR